MKSDSQMQAELIKPDRCRLQLIPLVDSNPVMKAGRHQSLWQLYLSPEGRGGRGWGLCTPLICHYWNSGLDSSGLPVCALHSVFLQMEDDWSSSTPHWKCQPASYLPDAGYQTTPTFMTLWEERLSLKRSRMAHVIPQGHRVFSKHITLALACFSLLLRTTDTRQREKENMQFPIGVGWREALMSVKQWMAVKDSCAPFVAANDSCSDEMGMKGWRQAIKCVVLQLFNQTLVCLLSRMVQQRSSRAQVAPSPPLMFRRLHPNLQSYRFILSSSVLL